MVHITRYRIFSCRDDCFIQKFLLIMITFEPEKYCIITSRRGRHDRRGHWFRRNRMRG